MLLLLILNYQRRGLKAKNIKSAVEKKKMTLYSDSFTYLTGILVLTRWWFSYLNNKYNKNI